MLNGKTSTLTGIEEMIRYNAFWKEFLGRNQHVTVTISPIRVVYLGETLPAL